MLWPGTRSTSDCRCAGEHELHPCSIVPRFNFWFCFTSAVSDFPGARRNITLKKTLPHPQILEILIPTRETWSCLEGCGGLRSWLAFFVHELGSRAHIALGLYPTPALTTRNICISDGSLSNLAVVRTCQMDRIFSTGVPRS